MAKNNMSCSRRTPLRDGVRGVRCPEAHRTWRGCKCLYLAVFETLTCTAPNARFAKQIGRKCRRCAPHTVPKRCPFGRMT